MVRLDATFMAADSITPDFAADIIQCASHFGAETQLEMGTTRVVLGSLIGILSLELRRGTKVCVIAEGADEQAAAESICKILETNRTA